MDQNFKGPVLQRDKETYAILARVPAGILTPENLENMAKTARKYGMQAVKITSAQRIAFIGLKKEDIEAAAQDLGTGIGIAEGPCVHYVQACPGNTYCKFGQQDSLGFAARIESLYAGKEKIIPAKTKIGISGCKLNCGESYLRDFGAFGTREGWTVVVGGNSGGRPCIGQVIAENLSDERALSFFGKCLETYARLAQGKERMPRLIQRIGIDAYKSELSK